MVFSPVQYLNLNIPLDFPGPFPVYKDKVPACCEGTGDGLHWKGQYNWVNKYWSRTSRMPGTEEITGRKSSTTDVSLAQTPGHRAVLCAISTTNSRALCRVKHTWKALAASSTKKRFWLKEPVSFECEMSSQAQMFKRLVLSQFVRESTGSFLGGGSGC